MFQGVPAKGTQKGDVYAFGILLYEIFGRNGPYGETVYSPSEIVRFVAAGENSDQKENYFNQQGRNLYISKGIIQGCKI